MSRISVENLDNQARDVRETRAAAFTTDGVGPDAADGTTAGRIGGRHSGRAASSLAVVAVAAGEGLAAIFREFGVAAVVQGGQSANPSTGELLEAIGAARGRARSCSCPTTRTSSSPPARSRAMTDRPVVVVPTRNAAEGFAALLALDPGLGAAENAGPMTEAGRAIQTLAVTEAVRDATIGGRKVKRGQTIALDPDDGLVAVNGDRAKCVLAAVASLDARVRAPDPVLRRRRRPGRGRGDGRGSGHGRDRRRRSRSGTAASRYYRYLIAAE